MEFSERKVPCRNIDTDDNTYRISTGQTNAALTESIAALGLIQAPIVRPKADRFIIISGFQRVLACRKIGMQNLPVRLASGHQSNLDYARLAVADNSFQRTLNLVEIARAVSLLKPHFDSLTALAETAAELCLPANPGFLEKVALLTTLEQNIQKQVVSGDIALPTALEFLDLDPPSVRALSDLFGSLKLSLNKQREVLTLLREIAALEDISITAVLQNSAIQNVLCAEDLDIAQKRQQLRSQLKKRRFPVLTHAETQMHKLIKKLPLGPHWQIIPPKHFEAQTYVFKATVRSPDELQQAHAHLENIVEAPVLKEIFKLSRKI